MGKFKKQFGGGDRKFAGPRPNFGRPNFVGGPRRNGPELFQAICSNCGKQCEVPFRPNGTKPVYCKECFNNPNRKGQKQEIRRDTFQPQAGGGASDTNQKIEELKRRVEVMSGKLDAVLRMVQGISVPAAIIPINETVIPTPVVAVAPTAQTTAKKAVKKALAKKAAKKKSIK